MTYIATFFTHFGAIEFRRICASRGWEARLSPVPRTLSSSCGTCVYFETSLPVTAATITEDTEQLVAVIEGGYQPIYRAENS